ncbi:MAG: hypothetical protein H7333_10205 [Bdellovibrionales bacterium]|nr:hypothetical protein [Oligoflexia bacterium]
MRIESGQGVLLRNKSFVEGSVDHGGIQPHYFIDLSQPKLAGLLKKVRMIKADYPVSGSSWKVAGKIRELVRQTLPRGAYDEPAYISLLAARKAEGRMVTLEDYVERGCGVCRENALLTHYLLTEAGIENRYLYVQVQIGHHFEDHAINVLTIDHEEWIMDSYNVTFNGLHYDELLRPEGFNPLKDKFAPVTPQSFIDQYKKGFAESPSDYVVRIVKINSYPQYAVPAP